MAKEIYKEKHHILPRCIQGTDNINNIVLLTAKEHFVCHHILTKVYKVKGIYYAFWRMCCDNRIRTKIRISAKVYDRCRQQIAIETGNMSRNNKFWLGRHHTPETKLKLSKSHKGKILSINHKLKITKNSWRCNQYGKNNKMFGKSGVLHFSARTFIITDPEGNTYTIYGTFGNNVKTFCEKHALNIGSFKKMCIYNFTTTKGPNKNWKIHSYEN